MDVISKGKYFESATGCEIVFMPQSKVLIMRAIEKPIGKLYQYSIDGLIGKELKLPLGYDISGELRTFSLDDTYHVLIGGPTRTGKSTTLNGWIYTLLNSPIKPQIIVGDCKRAEFSYLKRYIHLYTTVQEVTEALATIEQEMRRRLDILYDAEYENYKVYPGDMRRIVVIIDEMGEIKSKQAITHIDSLLRLSAATGIHLILASQRPSSTFLGKANVGDLKSNLIGRLAFSCSSKIDTNMILDQYVTMKKIPGRCMWRTTDDELLEVQAPFFNRRTVGYEQFPQIR